MRWRATLSRRGDTVTSGPNRWWLLLVDRDEDYVARISAQARPAGWSVVGVRDPLGAVDALGRHPWSLVLVGSPEGADGNAFLSTLRRVVPRLPSALIAEHPTPFLDRRIRQRGGLGCLPRERNRSALRALLDHIAAGGRGRRPELLALDETEAALLSGRTLALDPSWIEAATAAVEGFRCAVASGELDLPGRGDLLPRLQELAEAPETGAPDVVAVLETDPVVVTSVLHAARLASAQFATRTSTVHDACVRLGNQSVVAIARAVAIRGALQLQLHPWHDYATAWWASSEATSHLARLLAPRIGLPPQDGFLAGLLTNLGELALLAEVERWDPDGRAVDPLLVALREVMIREHSLIGGRLLDRWAFEPRWRPVVEGHHAPRTSGPLARLALLSWGLVLREGLTYVGHDPDGAVEPHLRRCHCDLPWLMDRLGLDPNECRRAAAEVVDRVLGRRG